VGGPIEVHLDELRTPISTSSARMVPSMLPSYQHFPTAQVNRQRRDSEGSDFGGGFFGACPSVRVPGFVAVANALELRSRSPQRRGR
jgi:hypothetical protein